MATSRSNVPSLCMEMKAAPKRLAYVAAIGGVQRFESQFRGARETENLRPIRYMACHPLMVIERFGGS